MFKLLFWNQHKYGVLFCYCGTVRVLSSSFLLASILHIIVYNIVESYINNESSEKNYTICFDYIIVFSAHTIIMLTTVLITQHYNMYLFRYIFLINNLYSYFKLVTFNSQTTDIMYLLTFFLILQSVCRNSKQILLGTVIVFIYMNRFIEVAILFMVLPIFILRSEYYYYYFFFFFFFFWDWGRLLDFIYLTGYDWSVV